MIGFTLSIMVKTVNGKKHKILERMLAAPSW